MRCERPLLCNDWTIMNLALQHDHTITLPNQKAERLQRFRSCNIHQGSGAMMDMFRNVEDCSVWCFNHSPMDLPWGACITAKGPAFAP